MLTVVKPSPLRLWGFLLTVLGGALVAFGSIGNWAAVSLGGSTENAVPTKGIDLWQGKITAILGVAIILGILALRFVRPERRNLLASGITVLALVALGIALWCVAALESVVRDTGLSQAIGAYGRKAVTDNGIDLRRQVGLLITIAGAIVAVAGGLVDLAWVRHKRIAGDAIDPDTLPVGAAEAELEPDA